MRALLFIPVIAGVLLTGAACTGPTSGAGPTTSVAAGDTGGTQDASPANSPAATKPAANPGTTASDKKVQSGGAATSIGAGVHTVLLRSYNTAAHTAVVEPVTLRSGNPELTITPSGKTYTLAVDPGMRLFTTQGGNPKCLQKAQNAVTIPGDCLDGGPESLPKEIKQNPDGWLVQVANNKSIYEIAELYRP